MNAAAMVNRVNKWAGFKYTCAATTATVGKLISRKDAHVDVPAARPSDNSPMTTVMINIKRSALPCKDWM